jgi:hypothetical protein
VTAPSGIDVMLVFTPVKGTYTARLEDQTYTLAGAFAANLKPGTHVVAGSFVGEGLLVGFASIGPGGVQSGSLRSEAGPLPRIAPCSVGYSDADASGSAREFRLQFQITANIASACGPPAP